MPAPLHKGLTLRGLEVFEALARTGSVAATAAELGMSAPAVSQQMKNLAQVLGVDLIDHSRRPMIPTPAGRLFLPRAEAALSALRSGQRDLTALDLSGLSALSLGVIEDFENEVTPRLAARLAEALSQCAFRLRTGASHNLVAGVVARDLDMAMCASPGAHPGGTTAYPILTDPYIVAVPQGTDMTGGLTGLSHLVFLRRDLTQVMGRQIETYLTRVQLDLPQRFEMDSNQSISALVASGTGWTITTPLSLLRAGRFAGGIDAHPLPDADIARDIVLLAGADWSGAIPAQIASLARELIEAHFVADAHARMPWLGHRFAVLGGD
ncbi:transcriptional regulator, LysR family [Roseibacterium elongatum DSM 19469]|uniref:Transcriptional regulator, LysR family n=1 Tax=Roseicyclus elongatus DSM 19469 TaxID=1294273 RepID=W8RPE1_9RHOB|nr:LysR family transcriptional regulator [Roseibacterium elongatum]AHM03014.1 transcriptional regulator, LysR family [Roseibacterium elongatum DSM 19469]